MADINQDQVDTADSQSIGSKLGEALLTGIKNIGTGLNKSGFNRDMLREVGRSMFTGGLATAGSNAAILSGDPTFAIEGQRLAAAVDKSIQQHWWITKAKEFETQKLQPLSGKFNTMKKDFDAKMAAIQGKFGNITNKYGTEKEAQLQAVLEDEKARGTLTPERIEQITAEIENIRTQRNNEINNLSLEYAELISNFNTNYGNVVMQVMNEAQTFDPTNPILGNMVANLVNILGNEAASFHDTTANVLEGRTAIQETDAINTQMGARPTVDQRQRVVEAETRSAEASSRIDEATAIEAERSLGRFPEAEGAPGGGLSPNQQIHNLMKDYIDRGYTEGQALDEITKNPNTLQDASGQIDQGINELIELLGYGQLDKEGALDWNEDLITANESRDLPMELRKLIVATMAVRSQHPEMTMAEATDYLDNINIKEGTSYPTAITIIQKRLAKDGVRATPGEIQKAMDVIQEENPNRPVSEVIGETIASMTSGTNKPVEGTGKQKKSIMDWFRSSEDSKAPSLREGPSPRQGYTPKNVTPTPAGKATPNKPAAISSKTTIFEDVAKGLFGESVTPKKLIDKVNETDVKDHPRVYGALLKLREELQRKAANTQNSKAAAALVNKIHSLNAFIAVYETNYPRAKHKEFYDEASKFLTSKKKPDSVLTKYGF